MTQESRDGRRGRRRRGGRGSERGGAAGGGTTGTIRILPGGGGLVAGVRIGCGATGTALDGDTVLLRRCGRRGGREFHAVDKVLARANGLLFGTVTSVGRTVTIEPDDLHLPERISLPVPCEKEGGAGVRKGDVVGFRITKWDGRKSAPRGEISELVGRAGEPGVGDKMVIRRHGLSPEFPEGALAEAREAAARLPAAGGFEGGRTDLRGDLVVTIDPDDSRDFDDAIGVEDTPDGWRLSVHVADVGHYVRPGGDLDLEAARRGNSTYLPGKVVPMLPEELSNGACSLLPGEDRHSFAVFLSIKRDGTVSGARFAKCVIRSKARLTYRRALEILARNPGDDVESMIHRAHALARALRARRAGQGALMLDFPEARAVIGCDGSTVGFDVSRGDDSHWLIEECMLAANEAVARKLRESSVDGIYRVHGAPEERDLLAFLAAAGEGDDPDWRHGHCLRGRVARAISRAKGRGDERSLISSLMKTMKKAAYSHDPLGHYGLSKSDYTHFTSPIRRYADLLVHRALEAAISGARTQGSLASVTGSLAEAEANSAAAERAAVHERKFEYLGRLGESGEARPMEAVVVEVKDRQMVVDVDEVALRCVMPIPGKGPGSDPSPGARIMVRVRELSRRGRRIEFSVADDGEGDGQAPSGGGGHGGRGRRMGRRRKRGRGT